MPMLHNILRVFLDQTPPERGAGKLGRCKLGLGKLGRGKLGHDLWAGVENSVGAM